MHMNIAINKQIRNLKAIELTFENIDYIIIPSPYFQSLKISPAKEGSAATFIFVLKKEANSAALHLEGDIHIVENENTSLFDRIAEYKDLTKIQFIFKDSSTKEYSVIWEDDDQNEYHNPLQLTNITPSGDLRVEIQLHESHCA